MENQLREKIIQNVLKTLNQLSFQYENTEDEIEHMKKGLYFEKGKMYDGKVWESYTTTIYHNVFDIPTPYYCIIDAETLRLKGLQTDHGVFEIIYNEKGEAKDKKFISPSFPYDKQ